MSTFLRRPAMIAAAITVAAGAVAGTLAIKPAVARDGSAAFTVGPFTLITCSHAGAPCQQYKNLLAGTGVEGDAASGTGVKGTSSGTGTFGVVGTSNKGTGVKGISTSGNGAWGISSTSNGVEGDSTSGNGVYGTSSSFAGVTGSCSSCIGVDGLTSTGSAVSGNASSNGYGVFGDSNSGVGAYGASTSSYGAEDISQSGDALYAYSSTGYAAIDAVTGSGNGYGVVSFANGMNAAVLGTNTNTNVGVGVEGQSDIYPIVAANKAAVTVAYIDGFGGVWAHQYFTFSRTRDGGSAMGFGQVSTSPTIEDDGTAQLINGEAYVSLDPAFAKAIDVSHAYHVMLTPDGDTRGLFVANKSATGFEVREVQGGRNSIGFDYHIFAREFGRANQRMTTFFGRPPGEPKSSIPHPRLPHPERISPPYIPPPHV